MPHIVKVSLKGGKYTWTYEKVYSSRYPNLQPINQNIFHKFIHSIKVLVCSDDQAINQSRTFNAYFFLICNKKEIIFTITTHWPYIVKGSNFYSLF
jgi:hypothetical protein